MCVQRFLKNNAYTNEHIFFNKVASLLSRARAHSVCVRVQTQRTQKDSGVTGGYFVDFASPDGE